jgi:hypothetical protein
MRALGQAGFISEFCAGRHHRQCGRTDSRECSFRLACSRYCICIRRIRRRTGTRGVPCQAVSGLDRFATSTRDAAGGNVLGDFDNAKFSHYGVESTFFKRDGTFRAPFKDGVAEVLAMETLSAITLEDKVAMAMIPRAKAGYVRSGMERIPVSAE